MTNKELEKQVNELSNLVKTLVDSLPKKEEVKTVIPESKPDDELLAEQELGGKSEPFPAEYRNLVDNTLNKSFGIHVKSDIGSFVFTILVPKKYSTMSDEQWKMYHFDKRVKVIPNAEGIEGVKLWVERIFNSFTPEYQSLIVSDRVANL